MSATTNVQVIIDAKDNASKVLKGLSGGFKNLEGDLRKVGTGLAAIGAAPTAALAGATKAAINFEDAFAGVRKTVDASESEFKQIATNFRNIAKETPITAIELSRIGELAGQLGVSGVDNISKFAKVMADMSVTTNLTSEVASTAFARIANIMQEPIENVDKMGSVVVELGNNFATTEAEIVEFANRIAGAGKIAGLSTADIFGMGAAFSSVGVQAEAGGTAVQLALIGMNTSVAQGGEELELFASVAGRSAESFKKQWKEDASVAFYEFVEGLADQGDNAVQVLDDLGLGNARTVRAFLSLANAGELTEEAIGSAAQAWDENSALTEEAEKRYETTASQIQILKNNINELGLVLGEQLLPKLNDVIEGVKGFVDKLIDFNEKHPGVLTSLLKLGAAVGVIGTAMVGLSFILPGLAALFSPLGLIIMAIVTAVGFWIASFKRSIEMCKKSIEAWKGVIDTIKVGIDVAKQKFIEFGENIIKFKDNAIQNFEIFKQGVVSKFEEVKMSIIGFFTALPGQVAGFIENFKNTIVTFFAELPGQISAFLELARLAIYDFFVVQIPYAIGFAVGRFERFVLEDIPNAWNMLVAFLTETVPMLVGQFIAWFIDMVTRSWQAVVHFATVQVPEAIMSLINWLSVEIPALAEKFVQWITQMGIDAWNALINFKDNAIDTLIKLKDNVIATVIALYEGFVAWIHKTIDDVVTGLNSLPGKVAAAMDEVKEKAVNKAKEIYEGVKEWFGKIIDFFDDIIDRAGEAINKAREAFSSGREAGQTKQAGGIVPGAIGTPVPIVAHGGERVIPANLNKSTGGGGGATFNVYLGMYAGTETEKRNIATDLYSALLKVAQSQNKNVSEFMGG